MAFNFGGFRPPMRPGGFAGGMRFGGENPLMPGGGSVRPEPAIRSFKKGGKVKKTGKYKLHKGEKVIPAKRKKSDSHAYVAGREA